MNKQGLKTESFNTSLNVKGPLDNLFTGLSHGPEGKGSPFGSATSLVTSINSLTKEVSILREEKEALESVREVQHLKLLKIQNKILDAVTEEKLESASLPELVRSYAMLKDKEHVMTGKATSITGIVGYLIQLEREDAARLRESLTETGTVLELNDGSFQVSSLEETSYSEFTQEEEELPFL